MLDLTFNGSKKEYVKCTRKTRAYFAPPVRNLLRVPSRRGAYLTKTEIDPLILPVRFYVYGDSEKDFRLKMEELAEWFVTDQPVSLIFDDDPEREYFAVVEGLIAPEENRTYAEFDMNFICPDPHKYGNQQTVDFENNVATVTNKGTAPTSPAFEIDVLEDITYLDLFLGDEYMRIGTPEGVDDVPVEREERVFWSQANTTVGWASGGPVDGGDVDGSMSSTGYSFYASDFGVGDKWHGPALKTSIPEAPLNDFIIDVVMQFPNVDPAHIGRVEVYLLDDQSRQVAKMAMKKTVGSSKGNTGEVRIGDAVTNEFIIIEEGDNGVEWKDFTGIFRFQRIGQDWQAYIAQRDQNGEHHSRRRVSYHDAENRFGGNFSQIQIHFGKHAGIPTPATRIDDIKVFRVNPVGANEIPYIARAGDKIVVDHEKSLITINGEDQKKLKDFGASFFDLKKGTSEVLLEPSNKVSGRVTFRERYL